MVAPYLAVVVQKVVQDSQFSFSRKYRLASRQDFQSVFDKPLKVKKKYLLALHKPNHLSHIRVGIIISKAHVRKAVDRNALRRLIREAIRQHPVTDLPHDVLILVCKGSHIAQALSENRHKIKNDVEKLLNHLVRKK